MEKNKEKNLGVDINTINMLSSIKRKTTDINLMDIVSSHLESYISKEASKIFMNDKSLIGVYQLPSEQQRLFINRWLINLLLGYRVKSGIVVTDTLIMIINDGYIEDWIKIFKMIILPFIIKNSILGKPTTK